MWLTANDTHKWAHRAGNAWPCSQLSGKRVFVIVDENGLLDFTLNGKPADVDGNELSACIADHLPAKLRQFWPCWE